MKQQYLTHLFTLTTTIITVSILYAGWLFSEQRYFIPESGLGYAFGIVGSCMMLLLLVYPARKRKPRWRAIGSIKFWFRFHMFLGIYGPLLIIYHSGYRLGSLNGSMALFSMIIVASSGLIGRYLYRRIHHGLYGKKINYEELVAKDESLQNEQADYDDDQKATLDSLHQISTELVNKHTAVNRSLRFFSSVKKQLKTIKKQLKKYPYDKQDKEILLRSVNSLLAICRLGKHEIYFSYWHILHIPLFIILILSGITHVVVVHFY